MYCEYVLRRARRSPAGVMCDVPHSGVPDANPLGVDGDLGLALLALHLDGDDEES
jgi:hypothetical protein